MTPQDEHREVVKRFGVVAERFCSLVDSMAPMERNPFLVQVYQMLPELINEAVRLPLIVSEDEVDDDSDDVPDNYVETTMKQIWARADVHHQEWKPLFEALKDKLGDWNLYWEVFDPTDDADHEPIYGSLADDIADIYCDLKKGLRLMEDPQAPAKDIIFAWRFNYYINWGHHAIDAIRTIHVRLRETFTGDNETT